MNLYPYQEASVASLEGGATLLAAVPGAGKTAIAITYAQRTGARLILVVCPAIAQGVWLAEVPKWWPEARAVLLRDLVAGKHPEGDAPTFVVVSYDYLVRNRIVPVDCDIGICDEAHALKSHTAKRTRLLLGPRCAGNGLLARCVRVILLTGTPSPNGLPSERWPALHALAPQLIDHMGFEAFVARYCVVDQRNFNGHQVSVIARANMRTVPELRERIRPFWHRPPLAEIEAQLPPMRWAIRHLAPGAVSAAAIREIEKSPEALQLRAAIDRGDLRQVEGHVSRIRRLLAMAKVPAAAAWAEAALEEGEPKVALWGWHVDALEELRQRLEHLHPAMVTGSTADRDAQVQKFQNDPFCKIWLGQIQAAGQAITLTACRRAVFLEQAWVPALNHQSLKRHHRLGQRHAVLGEVLVIPGSVDVAVAGLLERKTAEIAALEQAA